MRIGNDLALLDLPPEAVSGGKDWFGRVIVWETRRAEYGGSKEEPDKESSGECSGQIGRHRSPAVLFWSLLSRRSDV